MDLTNILEVARAHAQAHPFDITLRVEMSLFVTLGFDQGAKINRDDFLGLVADEVRTKLVDFPTEDLIDNLFINDITPEDD